MWTLLSVVLFSTAAASPTTKYSPYGRIMNTMLEDVFRYDVNPRNTEFMKNDCQRYGDNEAFNNFMVVMDNVIKDFPASAMQVAAMYLEDGDTLKSLDIVCKFSLKIKTSIAKVVSAKKPCIEPERREVVGNKSNNALSFLDYNCFNNSERVISFIQNGGEECIWERESKLMQCKYFAKREEETVNDIDNKVADSIEPTKKEDFKIQIAKNFRMWKRFKLCAKKELDQCPSPSTSTFMVGLLDSMSSPL